MEGEEDYLKSLRTVFIGAANQLTLLYTKGVNGQKQAYLDGYSTATKDFMKWIVKYSTTNNNNAQFGKRTIPVDELIYFLRFKLDETQKQRNEQSRQSMKACSVEELDEQEREEQIAREEELEPAQLRNSSSSQGFPQNQMYQPTVQNPNSPNMFAAEQSAMLSNSINPQPNSNFSFDIRPDHNPFAIVNNAVNSSNNSPRLRQRTRNIHRTSSSSPFSSSPFEFQPTNPFVIGSPRNDNNEPGTLASSLPSLFSGAVNGEARKRHFDNTMEVVYDATKRSKLDE